MIISKYNVCTGNEGGTPLTPPTFQASLSDYIPTSGNPEYYLHPYILHFYIALQIFHKCLLFSFGISHVSVVGATISSATSRAGVSSDVIYIVHNNLGMMQNRRHK